MAANNNSTCAGCLGALRPKDDVVSCTRANCNRSYHKDICVGGSAPRLDELVSWVCPQCKCESKRGGDNTSTPVRGTPCTPDNVTLRTKKGLPTSDLQELTSEIRFLREEVSSFKAKLGNVSSAMQNLNEQMHQLVARVTISDERVLEMDQRYALETEALKNRVRKLEEQMNSQAQAYHRNEIEIIGIPELPNENLQHIALVAAKKIGADIGESDLDWVLRAGVKKPPSSSSAFGFSRPIVMRLIRRSKRDELLKCVKSRKNVTTKDLGVDDQSKRVYFNERLTKENRLLFREARSRAASAGWKFCWTNSGSVFLRKREGSPAILVRSIAELEDKFGHIESAAL